MFKIYIIGAGQIGSRHLQALKKVKIPLDIIVIDPSKQSLAVSRQRYEEVSSARHSHIINYIREIPDGQDIDLAIIATASNIRAKIIKNLLQKNTAQYLILEKLLFDKKNDYLVIEKIFSKLKIKAWVNCPTRIRPIYQKIQKEMSDRKISLRVTGSQWGLATNAIHYLDFVSDLAKESSYLINADYLDKKLLPSKRKDFLELSGTLYADFKNGSRCELTDYNSGSAPWLVEIFNEEKRYIIRQSDGKVWESGAKNKWQWKEIIFKTPFISETTTGVVEDILKNGRCHLTPYSESAKIHLALLEPLIKFLNKNFSKKYEYYPFT